MTQRNFILFFLLWFLFTKCHRSSDKQNVVEQNMFDTNQQHQLFKKEDLTGVWAKNQNANAVFEIIGDSIYYLEQSKPYFLKLQNDSLLLYLDSGYIEKLKLVKITNDSLIYKHDDGEITMLYKRE